MLVPEIRLLLWAAVLLPAASGWAILSPDSALLSALVLTAFAALAAIDAGFAPARLQAVEVEFSCPVIRLTKDRPGSIEIKLRHRAQRARRLRLGFAWPAEIEPAEETLLIDTPKAAELSRVIFDCTARRRGRFPIERAYLEGSSPLKLWAFRTTRPLRGEVRVYPNLWAERRHVAALFLNRGQLGVHSFRQVGKGRDFDKLREYSAGDSYDDIHWKATAKRGRPITKDFQVERTQEVYVIIDSSRLSARDSGNGTFLERFVNAALILGLAAQQQGDLYGLITFSDRVQKFVRAKGGPQHFHTCRDALYALQPSGVTPDFQEICSFIRLHLRRRALLVFLTGLDDPVLAESFKRSTELINRQHLLLVNMLRPQAARPLFHDGPLPSTDAIYEALAGHILWHELREFQKALQHRGVQFHQLDHETLALQLVTQYSTVKRRQIL